MPSAYVHLHSIHVGSILFAAQLKRRVARYPPLMTALMISTTSLQMRGSASPVVSLKPMRWQKSIRFWKRMGTTRVIYFFAQALNLCTHRLHRRAFLDLKTKEGRYNYVKVSWDVMTLKSKWIRTSQSAAACLSFVSVFVIADVV